MSMAGFIQFMGMRAPSGIGKIFHPGLQFLQQEYPLWDSCCLAKGTQRLIKAGKPGNGNRVAAFWVRITAL